MPGTPELRDVDVDMDVDVDDPSGGLSPVEPLSSAAVSLIAFSIAAFSAVFSVVDPFGVVPVYITLTKNDSAAHARRTALRAAIAMVVALCAFALAGSGILHFFGITIAAFRIAGGTLLFLMAVDMLRAQPSRERLTPEEESEGVEKPDVSIFPLAVPMLSGPGSMATVMVLMGQATDLPRKLAVLGAIGACGLLTFIILVFGKLAERRLGKTGLNVLHRVMGLLLAAIAAQFVLDGLLEALPGLAGKH